MPRIIDAFQQFFDDNGDPLVNGKLKFVVSGTNNTDKDTFADINETIKNSNPVILSGAGRCPNVFGTGSYNVISYTSDDVQIQQFDPVSSDSLDGAFSDWDAITIYGEGDLVTGSDGLYYRSITSGNQNQNPVSTPSQWEEVKFVGIWNTNISYSLSDVVYGSDGFLYLSKTNTNSGNNPTTDTTNWTYAVSHAQYADATGTVDAITATFSPPLVLRDNQEVRVRASGANTISNPTFDPNGAGALPIVKEGSRALAIGDIGRVDHELILNYNLANTEWELLNPTSINQINSITGTVAADALTVGLDASSLDFRDSALTDGAAHGIVSDAVSLIVPSGATLGTESAVESDLILFAIDNAGTVELAIGNLSGAPDLTEEPLISTTAISTGSDSNSVIYSTSARTDVPYRVVGKVTSTQAAAGTWATAPSILQGGGGRAISGAAQSGASLVLLGTASASASATIDFTGLDATYDEYVFILTSIIPATNASLLTMLVGDSGSYRTASYQYHVANLSNASAAYAAVATGAGTSMYVSGSIGNAAGRSFSGNISIQDPSNAALSSHTIVHGEAIDGTGNPHYNDGSGTFGGTPFAIDRVRFLMSAGNIASGEFALYGIKKS